MSNYIEDNQELQQTNLHDNLQRKYVAEIRVIRMRDAPAYLGMNKHRFNADVRPYLIEFSIGKQGIGFEKVALDAWLDQYIHCNGRPGVNSKRRHSWQSKKFQGLRKSATSGTSIKKLTAADFAKALEQVVSKKQKNI